MGSRPALLILDDLTVAPEHAPDPLLTGIDLSLLPGECVALVGPSGSGKTTLLRTVAGMIPPLAGEIRLAGEVLAPTGRARRMRSMIGMITQMHDMVGPLRVDRNVLAGALGRMTTWQAFRLLMRIGQDEAAQAEAALAAVGLAGMGRRTTATLSGGEQQRVAIARALVQAPVLLLADEPVASLDRARAIEVLGLLTGLARSTGTALLCALHQPDLAERFCDRTIELRGGRLVELSRAPEAA